MKFFPTAISFRSFYTFGLKFMTVYKIIFKYHVSPVNQRIMLRMDMIPREAGGTSLEGQNNLKGQVHKE